MRLAADQRAGIEEILSTVLSQTRPEELLLVPGVFDKEVDVSRRSDALGFGADAQTVLWLYPLFSVLSGIAVTAADGFAKKWGEQLAQWLWNKVGHGTLDAEALNGVRADVIQHLLAEGVGAQDSERVGDCLISELIRRPTLLRQIAGAK
jgi:hypothetical protein